MATNTRSAAARSRLLALATDSPHTRDSPPSSRPASSRPERSALASASQSDDGSSVSEQTLEALRLQVELARLRQASAAHEEAAHRRRMEQEEAAHNRRMEELQAKAEYDLRLEEVRMAPVQPTPRFSEWKLQPLPPFDEGRDKIETYLEAFERQAKAAGIPSNQWLTRLNPLLAASGRAGETYRRCLEKEDVTYQSLKEALLWQFNVTSEGYRRRFRNLRPQEDECPSIFADRLSAAFECWMRSEKAEDDPEGIRSVILKEQIMKCYTEEERTFVNQSEAETYEEVVAALRRYVGARRFGKKQSFKPQGKPFKARQSNHEKQRDKPSSRETTTATPQKYDRARIKRIIAEAREAGKRGCWLCGDPDHYTRRCPSMPKDGLAVSVPRRDADLTVTTAPREDLKPSCEGKVEGRSCAVLRDTGCDCIVVRKDLVPEENMLTKRQKVILMDGSVVECPLARVEIQSTFYTGRAVAIVMTSPVYPCVIGNVRGAQPGLHPHQGGTPAPRNTARTKEAKREHVGGIGSGETKPHTPDEFSSPSQAMPMDDETVWERAKEVARSADGLGGKVDTLSAPEEPAVHTPASPIPCTPRGITAKAPQIPPSTASEGEAGREHHSGCIEEVIGTASRKPETPSGTPTEGGFKRDGTPAIATPPGGRKVEVITQTTPATLHPEAAQISRTPQEIPEKPQRLISQVAQETQPIHGGGCRSPALDNTSGDDNFDGTPSQPDSTSPLPPGEESLVDRSTITPLSAGALTRARARTGPRARPLDIKEILHEKVTRDEIIKSQREDHDLSHLHDLVGKDPLNVRGKLARFRYCNGMLMREVEGQGATYQQIVIPRKFRHVVMELAHDSLLAGHYAAKRTLNRIAPHFFWSGMTADIKRFCQSCDRCQRTIPRGRVAHVPLGQVPIVSEPFQRVAVDIIGPLSKTTSGKRYILVLVDYATRFPEATALRDITTETVAEALVEMFARFGLPQVIRSDRGSQFTSAMMDEICRLMGIHQSFTSAFHPQSNGLVERMNQVLKNMLKKAAIDQPEEWDRYLAPLLFAYREIPNAGTGFAPFELLYGRTPRGPLQILRDVLTAEAPTNEVRTIFEYVVRLKERLNSTCQMAQETLGKEQKKRSKYYNAKARERTFKDGDEVLLLLPDSHDKLTMRWRGPYPVEGRRGANDYEINVDGHTRVYHANMIKAYHRRGGTCRSDHYGCSCRHSRGDR